MLKSDPLIRSLMSLRGNQRACVYTEPLWGIPNNLYAPFMGVYMYALGVNDRQIGVIASVNLFLQIFSALLGGIITDKLGRRRTTAIFDLLGWSIPCLIWMFSQNFWWFITATSFNSLLQITTNSWTCLLVEDADESIMVDMFNWVYMSGQFVVFFAPLSGILVKNLSVVPAMRIIFFASFISMTAKFVILYIFSTETSRGEIRLRETKDVSVFRMLYGYAGGLSAIFNVKSPKMLLTLLILIIFQITSTMNGTFFGLFVTKSLMLPEQNLAYFPILRSIVMLVFFFGAQGFLSRCQIKAPMIVGIILYIISHLCLILSPPGSYIGIVPHIITEACAYALVIPRKEAITALFVEPKDRARILSLMTVFMLLAATPFGYIGGYLSDLDRRLPFCLSILLYVLALAVVIPFNMRSDRDTREA